MQTTASVPEGGPLEKYPDRKGYPLGYLGGTQGDVRLCYDTEQIASKLRAEEGGEADG